MGPFYCPGDSLRSTSTSASTRPSAGRPARGPVEDFAQAYVIAHEVGHHVQHLLGHHRQGRRRCAAVVSPSRRPTPPASAWNSRPIASPACGPITRSSPKAGWKPGDIDEALNAAAKIDDDTLQRSAGRAVVPESLPHGGTSDPRSSGGSSGGWLKEICGTAIRFRRSSFRSSATRLAGAAGEAQAKGRLNLPPLACGTHWLDRTRFRPVLALRLSSAAPAKRVHTVRLLRGA